MQEQPNELSSSTAGMMSSPLSTAYDAVRLSGTTATLLLQASHWLELVTYKPGWRFELAAPAYADIHYVAVLWIRFRAPDTYGKVPGEMEVVSNNLVPEYLLENQRKFYDYVHHCITAVEMHELDEWFKVGGRLVKNPHDPNDPEVWSPGNEIRKPPAQWSMGKAQLRITDEAYMMKEEYFETQIQRKAGD